MVVDQWAWLREAWNIVECGMVRLNLQFHPINLHQHLAWDKWDRGSYGVRLLHVGGEGVVDWMAGEVLYWPIWYSYSAARARHCVLARVESPIVSRS